MTKHGSTLFFLQLFSCFTALHSFSLKNCTIEDSESVVVLCQNSDLKEIPDDIPRNSEMLDVSFNKISELNATNLRNLINLLSLSLSHNHIFHIDDYTFADLKSLKTLKLSYNNLTNLTDHIFEGLDNLVSLHLQHNHISQISPKAFQPLVSSQRVFLDWNHIDHIRDIAVLFQSPNVEVISLSTNHITFFDSDDLPFNTTNLKILHLDSNPLKNFSLKQDIFPHLHFIDLYKSTILIDWEIVNKTFLSITELTLGGYAVKLDTYTAILHSTSSLQTLHLTVVNPRWINGAVESACKITSLRRLELSRNILNKIDDNLLRSCSQLTSLIVILNNLKQMSDQSLKSLTQLKFLQLNSNQLPKVPVTIRGLSTLENLDLSVNYISELDGLDFINLTKLTKLDLRGNRITRLQQGHFQNLYNLKTLDISKNLFYSLENPFSVNMSKLETLDLSGNVYRLSIKQGEFRNLTSLRFLNLQSKTYYLSDTGAFERLNNLKSLDFSVNWYSKDLFQELTQLEVLELHFSSVMKSKDSKNDTDEPPFSGLPNLKVLSLKVYEKFAAVISPDLLSGLTSLTSFRADNFFQNSVHPDTFKYTPRLLKLQIINSFLSTLSSELFQPIPQLQHLDLSNNTFQSLDFPVNLKALRWLRAPKNHLSIVNVTTIQTLTALRFLDLTNNPLTCECSNAAFQQWALTNNQTQVINGHQYKCAFPVSQQTNMFLDFDTHSCWIDTGFICFITNFCLILLTIFVAFVYSFLRWQLTYAYYLFLAYVHDSKSRKEGAGHIYDAFISYNVNDEDWVYSEMLPMLEGQQGWKLCLHHRDFEPGKPIVDNITDAIYSSRKTICVISQDYLQSEWCSREIQIASIRLFDEQKDVLVLAFLEDIPKWRLSPYYQIRRLVKKHTYLSWPQAAQHKGVFWQKLNQALKTGNAPNDNRHLIIEPEDA